MPETRSRQPSKGKKSGKRKSPKLFKTQKRVGWPEKPSVARRSGFEGVSGWQQRFARQQGVKQV